MTPQDIARLLDYLRVAYPSSPALSDDTPLIWLQHLNELDLDLARQAAHRWVDREKWMPAIAEFKAECVAVKREAYEATRTAEAHAALEAAKVAPETAKENRVRLIAEMRAMLARQSTAKHDHHWPNPCPVCGGMGTPPKPSKDRTARWKASA